MDNITPLQSQQIPFDRNLLENSNLKTKKKTFISDVDPHSLKRKIQQERYIWFGVCNELLRNKNIIKILQKCKDQALPIESASIHLDKYKIGFNKNRIYIKPDENGVIFFKLYLITKEQFKQILNTYYLCDNKILTSNFFNTLNKPETQILLNEYQKNTNAFYNVLRCVGQLDSINIYTVTTDCKELIAPEPDYLRTIFNGLKKSFSPYSEFLLMYYIYLLDGVKNFYSIKQLQEVFVQPKTQTESSSASSETNMTIGETNQKYLVMPQNTLDNLNATPPPNIKRDNETVKCSTCNASPFMGTDEKDQLNQYSYIFDLHHLPIFDENTGEFFWSNNEAGWKNARNSIAKSDGLNLSGGHGSLVNLSNSFYGGRKCSDDGDKEQDIKYENSGTFIEELNNILKEIQ